MKMILTLTSYLLVALMTLRHCADARPDLSLGYRYQQGHSSGGGNLLSAPTYNAGPSSSYLSTPGLIGTSGFVPSTQLLGGSIGGYGLSESLHQEQYNNNNNNINLDEQQAFLSHLQNHQAPIVTKHFYIHSAPVDHEEQQIVRYINVGRPQKNYRVVFIDAPSSTTSKAKIIANLAPVEDKTAIYVLSKKSNALDVSTEVVTPAPVHNKPEVFFIKYKTPEEAHHAQQTIQAQYDALGGSSDVSNEGIVPISSVIGSLDLEGAHHGGESTSLDNTENISTSSQGGVSILHTGINTQATYLPSSLSSSSSSSAALKQR